MEDRRDIDTQGLHLYYLAVRFSTQRMESSL